MNWDVVDGVSLSDLNMEDQHWDVVDDASLGDLNMDEQFIDQSMFNGPTYDGLEFDQHELDAQVQPAGDSISQTRKRTFDEVETIDALQDGI